MGDVLTETQTDMMVYYYSTLCPTSHTFVHVVVAHFFY